MAKDKKKGGSDAKKAKKVVINSEKSLFIHYPSKCCPSTKYALHSLTESHVG